MESTPSPTITLVYSTFSHHKCSAYGTTYVTRDPILFKKLKQQTHTRDATGHNEEQEACVSG